ncbi:EscU/YscU/HrcU family type III secretion system export apparatus switch protein [Acetobacter conturbans]|uniref:Flagellar type III secretion system protein FlhB n=1 Tax=Acetobacter conturbans TaxID=1737472 RepID=A0ABX0K324_9PROT|nr:flagellar type III secretion system protein FlhB [Acetobacter conturbans]
MAESSGGDNTEAPTGRRLERARDEGNVAQSKELHLFSGLALSTIALVMFLPTSAKSFLSEMSALFNHAGETHLNPDVVAGLLKTSFSLLVMLSLPIVLAAVAGGITTALLQSGFLMRADALIPDIGRLNPLKGIKKLFGVSSLIEALKSIVKVIVFSLILYGIVKDTLQLAPKTVFWSAETFMTQFSKLTVKTLISVLVVQIGIIIFDEGWTRYKRLQDLKMSRQDIKDEMRQSDGDPHVKGRQKQMRMQRNRKVIREAIQAATVVVTNPTHYAVALSYETGGGGAPKIVAKGADDLAARIREFAYEAKVPIVSNPPLARSLYKLPEDTEIPYEYFQAVAAIIAYVWRMKQPAGAQRPPVM